MINDLRTDLKGFMRNVKQNLQDITYKTVSNNAVEDTRAIPQHQSLPPHILRYLEDKGVFDPELHFCKLYNTCIEK